MQTGQHTRTTICKKGKLTSYNHRTLKLTDEGLREKRITATISLTVETKLLKGWEEGGAGVETSIVVHFPRCY